ISGRISLPTAQFPKGITHSYKLGIEQILWCWKDHSKIFANITRTTPNSSWSRSYVCSKLAKNSLFPILSQISRSLKKKIQK
ncbi:hypothetical protein MTR67_042484, partial [Solanum verrucosum]